MATFTFFRLLPHAAFAISVALTPSAFASRSYWLLAMAGMGYVNLQNVRRRAGGALPVPQLPLPALLTPDRWLLMANFDLP